MHATYYLCVPLVTQTVNPVQAGWRTKITHQCTHRELGRPSEQASQRAGELAFFSQPAANCFMEGTSDSTLLLQRRTRLHHHHQGRAREERERDGGRYE